MWNWWLPTLTLRLENKNVLLLSYTDVQHGGKSCAPIVVIDDGFDDKRGSRTILVNASATAHACAELREFSRQFGTRCLSDCLFFFAPDVATVVSRNLVDRCLWLPLHQRNAPRHVPFHCGPRKLDVHSFISAVAPDAVGREVRDRVTWFPVILAIDGEDPLKIIRCVIATRDLKDFRFADRTGKCVLGSVAAKASKGVVDGG